MAGAVVPTQAELVGRVHGLADHPPDLRVKQPRIQVDPGQADAHTTVAPGRRSPGPGQHSQIQPVLFVRIEQGVFEAEGGSRRPGEARVTRGCAQLGQRPAQAAATMGEAAEAVRPLRVAPEDRLTPVLGPL